MLISQAQTKVGAKRPKRNWTKTTRHMTKLSNSESSSLAATSMQRAVKTRLSCCDSYAPKSSMLKSHLKCFRSITGWRNIRPSSSTFRPRLTSNPCLKCRFNVCCRKRTITVDKCTFSVSVRRTLWSADPAESSIFNFICREMRSIQGACWARFPEQYSGARRCHKKSRSTNWRAGSASRHVWTGICPR